MAKLIQLKLSRIKYTGDSIGDDIRMEVECLDKFVGLNKRLKRGSEVVLNTEVGQFFADGTSFTLPVSIKIIERDLIFNDVGATQKNLKVNLNNPTPQPSTFKVEVREQRGYLSRKKAVFELIMATVVSDAILYVADEGGDGWVMTKPERGTEKVSLPYHLRVALEKQDETRQYFTVMEGVLQAMKGSVQIEPDGASRLSAHNPHTATVHLTYSLSRGTLKSGHNVCKVLNYPLDPDPWEKGLYDIEIPDAPHGPGETYVDRARLAKVWFRVGHSGARYLHAGSVTRGCVTMTEIGRWDDLCQQLMKARKGDGRSIGTLEMID